MKPAGEKVFSASGLPAAAEQEEATRLIASCPDHLVQRVSVFLWHSVPVEGLLAKTLLV